MWGLLPVDDDAAPTPKMQDVLAQSTIFLFSVALGMATLVIPLVATAAGYPLGAIGLLIGLSAITQIIARAGMGSLMDRFSTRTFILLALILLAASCGILGVSDDLWAFVVSQLLQGAARAYFFTGAQTHVVRSTRPAVSSLALMNVTNGIGLLVGPLLAGFIGASSLTLTLFIAGGMSAAAIPACACLVRYEPFTRPPSAPGVVSVAIWRRPGVLTAAWMSAAAGSWRGIMNSYLPLLLSEAGHTVPVVGAMTTLANFAALAGSVLARGARRAGMRRASVLGTVLALGGIAAMVLLLPNLVLAGAFLFISGVGSGILQTLGPALAAEAVGPEERGRSIASIGTFRAFSLLVTPMSIGALIFVLPSAAVATAIVAIAVGIPVMVLRTRPPRGMND
jgi:MFS family permease